MILQLGVAMGGLLLKLQNFKKVNLIFGHPVHNQKSIFAVNLPLKLFPATVANANFGSLKLLSPYIIW